MPPLPDVATQPKLEDAFRPTHFAGVCKVVARLFDIVRPAQAFFGEKDYQQLRVISEMVREHASRWRDLRIVPCPTERERDGLAMSSRNVYLTSEQRKTALTLWRAIIEAKQEKTPADAEDVMRVLLEEAGFAVDYAVVRESETLLPVERYDRPCRGLIAAKIGTTRLIDNMVVESAR
jgi:pantoate--beta-alanine ligase